MSHLTRCLQVLLLSWGVLTQPDSKILLTKTSVGSPLYICLPGAITNQTEIGLQNCNNDQYIGVMGIGSPPQNFTFLFDTGSDVLWIPKSGCVGQCSSKQFNPSASTTYNPGGYDLTLDYGSGSNVFGNFGSDIIHFSNTAINISNPILFVSQDNQVTNMQSNGLIALGYNLSVNNPFDSAFKAGQIATYMFAVEILAPTLQSALYFNNIPEWITNSTVFVPQYGTGHWQAQVIGFYANDIELSSYASSNAIIDSGTSLFYLNQLLYNQIVDQFFQGCTNLGSNITCPCDFTFPNFTIYFAGIKVYIYGNNYTNSCAALFGPMTGGGILLGDIFMRNYIVTYDKQEGRLGFKGNMGLLYLIGAGSTYFFYISQIVCTALVSLLFILAIVLCISLYKSKRTLPRPNLNTYLIEM